MQLIDREVVLPNGVYYVNADDPMRSLDILLDRIANAPTIDAVQVVRCKDCKHCDPESKHCDHPMGTAMPVPRKEDDFCSYGERRSYD